VPVIIKDDRLLKFANFEIALKDFVVAVVPKKESTPSVGVLSEAEGSSPTTAKSGVTYLAHYPENHVRSFIGGDTSTGSVHWQRRKNCSFYTISFTASRNVSISSFVLK